MEDDKKQIDYDVITTLVTLDNEYKQILNNFINWIQRSVNYFLQILINFDSFIKFLLSNWSYIKLKTQVKHDFLKNNIVSCI